MPDDQITFLNEKAEQENLRKINKASLQVESREIKISIEFLPFTLNT